MSVDADSAGMHPPAAPGAREEIASPALRSVPAQRLRWIGMGRAGANPALSVAGGATVPGIELGGAAEDAATRVAAAIGLDTTAPRVKAQWLRARGWHLEALVGGAVGVAVALATGAALPALLALTAWSFLSFPRMPALGGPLLRQLKPLAQGAVVVLGTTAFLVTAGVADVPAQAAAVSTVLAAALVAGAARAQRLRLAGPVRVIVVGDRMDATRWVDQWSHRRDVKVVGATLLDPDGDNDGLALDHAGVPTATSLDELPHLVQAWGADMVAFAPSPGLTPTLVRRTAWSLQDSGVALAVVGLFDGVAPHRITPGVIGGETLCEVEPPARPAGLVAVKHGVDRVAAALLLVLVAPVLAVLAVMVRLDSEGSAFFRQTRVGHNGRHFTLYKLRTMRTDAEQLKAGLRLANEQDGVLFKMQRDPRVTRVGYALRRSSLDELPQLLNVLRGEMSLVGPRPFLPAETAAMSTEALRRLAVRPGITGLWQIRGRSDLGWEQSVALDTYYADNWTLGGDVQIALRTLDAVVRAKGAY